MDFDLGIQKVSDALKHPLPGEPAQRLLAPLLRKRTHELKQVNKNYRESSVMILLYRDEKNNLTTLFIERPIDGSIHSGQIAFPGGKVEPDDESLSHTALRETEEEVGVPLKEIEVLGRMTELFIPASNFLVHPHIGVLHSSPAFTPDPKEVNSLIPFEVETLLGLVVGSTTVKTSYGNLEAPYFDIQGHTVWGATAMIVSEFRYLFEK